MRRRTWVVLMLFIGLLHVLAGTASIDLCDYRTPEADLQDMRFSFNYRHFNDGGTDEEDVSSGRLTVDYDRLLNTDTLGFTVTGKAEIALQDFTPTSGLGQGAFTLRSYTFEEMPLFFVFGGMESSFATGQEKPNLEIRAGFGYGRFSDVTPLAKAIKIQNKLFRTGKIKERLPDEVLLAIADQISQRAEFASMEELMSAIQTLIEDEAVTVVDPVSIVMIGTELNTWQALVSDIADMVKDASGTPLDAEILMIIQEQILTTGDSRNCGWAVQGGIGYDLVTHKTLLTMSFDAAVAPDPASQVLLRTSLSGPLVAPKESALGFSASYDYLVKDDISLFASYTLQVKPAEEFTTTTHSASLELAFNLGTGDLSLQIALTKDPTVPKWSTDVILSLVLDLL
jgi:hypothetical protein